LTFDVVMVNGVAADEPGIVSKGASTTIAIAVTGRPNRARKDPRRLGRVVLVESIELAENGLTNATVPFWRTSARYSKAGRACLNSRQAED
jgi:hypothetical protein